MAAARRRWLRGFCGTLFRAVISAPASWRSAPCQGAMWAKLTTVECSTEKGSADGGAATAPLMVVLRPVHGAVGVRC